MQNPFDDFVSSKGVVPLFANAQDEKGVKRHLLWGDGVKHLDAGPAVNGRRLVRARGSKGWVRESDLGGKALLELYFIDVGQGDGVLVRTPDFRHLLIDGGFPRSQQPSRKGAADFVDWKFAKDYGVKRIELDVLMASHNDHDHYGGLDDLLDVKQIDELDCTSIAIERFFHAGLSWWKDAAGERTLGRTQRVVSKGEFFVDLLGDRAAAESALDGQSSPQLQGKWGEFIGKVVQARDAAGQPTPIQRLSHLQGLLPGFDGSAAKGVRIQVLGPIEHPVKGRPALRKLGGDSISTNGQSILLSLQYGKARILLTGDLNKAAHDALFAQYAADPTVFACDVAKCCHHGSEDVSLNFLKAMEPGATVISSGDAEGHDHPRPRIVAASGLTGHVEVKNDELITPLVYSTEIARSYQLGQVHEAELPDQRTLDAAALQGTTVRYRVHKPGSLNPVKGERPLGGSFVVAGLTYGLVNVRTDGKTILCATLNEGKPSWTIKTFKARF